MSAESPLPADHPMLIAWHAWKKTENYKIARNWNTEKMHGALDGALWSAFVAGQLYGDARGFNAGVQKCADWIEKRADAYHEEHGHQDMSTGAWEYPGDGAEYLGGLEEIKEALLALAKSEQPT